MSRLKPYWVGTTTSWYAAKSPPPKPASAPETAKANPRMTVGLMPTLSVASVLSRRACRQRPILDRTR